MKTLHVAIMIIAVITTTGVTVMTFLTIENKNAEQNQADKLQARVHVITDNGTKYVKVDDLSPNSAVPFTYPYTGNVTIDASAFHRWELIRLPKDLGGDKADISSFRAYSMVDINHWCLTIYRPNIEKLEEPCNNGEYEPVNGIAVVGLAMYQKYNALPNLDLGIDEEGFIYVKPPTFEFDKNGVIGAGRQPFHCTDPQQTELQYDTERLTMRQQIESIVLSDPRLQQIIGGNSCEFMADGILYTENGTMRTININLNNTQEISASVSLQNNTVLSYQVGNLTRA